MCEMLLSTATNITLTYQSSFESYVVIKGKLPHITLTQKAFLKYFIVVVNCRKIYLSEEHIYLFFISVCRIDVSGHNILVFQI